MKNLLATIFLLLSLSAISPSCSKGDGPAVKPPPGQPGGTPQPDEDSNNGSNDGPIDEKIIIKIGSAVFTVTLQDNAAAKAFRTMLPITVTMNEHAGNEKYHNLSNPLPVDAFRPGTIQTGDLMLWGDNCLVLFYETFSSSYSYTRIGKTDDPTGLRAAVGDGRVTVTFESLYPGAGTQD